MCWRLAVKSTSLRGSCWVVLCNCHYMSHATVCMTPCDIALHSMQQTKCVISTLVASSLRTAACRWSSPTATSLATQQHQEAHWACVPAHRWEPWCNTPAQRCGRGKLCSTLQLENAADQHGRWYVDAVVWHCGNSVNSTNVSPFCGPLNGP